MFKFRPDSPQCGCSFASPSFKGTELSPPTHPHTIFQMSGVVRIFFPSSLAPPPHRYQRSHTFDLDPLGSSWITARNCETPVVYLGHPSPPPPITTHHHPTRMNCSSQSVQVAGEELTGLHTAVIFGATFLQFRLVQDISRITGHLQVMGSSKPAQNWLQYQRMATIHPQDDHKKPAPNIDESSPSDPSASPIAESAWPPSCRGAHSTPHRCFQWNSSSKDVVTWNTEVTWLRLAQREGGERIIFGIPICRGNILTWRHW